MDTTGWLITEAHIVKHAHPRYILSTVAEAMAKENAYWHVASIVHDDTRLHAYYNSFNPDSTRWAPRTKQNTTAAQRREAIINAQAEHNSKSGPVNPHFSDSNALPPGEPTSAPDDTPIPTEENALPAAAPTAPVTSGNAPTDALTALIEEQAKMSALALKASVETRTQLSGFTSDTSATISGLRKAALEMAATIEEQAAAIVAQAARLEALEQSRPQEITYTYKRSDGSEYKSNGRTHSAYPRLYKIMTSFPEGERNVYMYGPAGVGKTHMAQELAKALGVRFYTTGAVAAKHELLGYMNAAGDFVPTQFHTAMTTGGVFLFDEVDGSFPNALLSVQTALANKFVVFPNSSEPQPVNANTYLICAANTDGSGADANYSSRNKQDGAFMDRFQVMSVDYDDEFEVSRVPAEYVSLARAIVACRHNAQAARRDPRSNAVQGAGAQIIISQRSIWRCVRLLQGGHFSPTEVAEMAFPQYQKLNTYATLFAPLIEWAKNAEKRS